MPISLQDLSKKTATVNVDFDGATCAVVYRPGILTPELLEELTTATTNANESLTTRIARQICTLVVSWEIMTGGEAVPITPEGVRKVPFLVLNRIIRDIMRSMAPGKDSDDDSSEGSFSTNP